MWQSLYPAAVRCKCVIIVQFCPCPYSFCYLQSYVLALLEGEVDISNTKHTFHKAKFSTKTINLSTLQENYIHFPFIKMNSTKINETNKPKIHNSGLA